MIGLHEGWSRRGVVSHRADRGWPCCSWSAGAHPARGMRARQIAVTDAIHGELGAIVAPVVRRWLWGRLAARDSRPVRRSRLGQPRDPGGVLGPSTRPSERSRPIRDRAEPAGEIRSAPERAAVVAARRSRGESASADMNPYFAEWLVRERLAEARAAGARSALVDAAMPERPPDARSARAGTGESRPASSG